MKKVTVLLGAAALVSGCVSMGTNYDPAAVAKLQPGMTRSEVVALLGKPNSIATAADGSEQLLWVHSKGSMFGATARSVTLPFGTDGRLIQAPTQTTTQIQ